MSRFREEGGANTRVTRVANPDQSTITVVKKEVKRERSSKAPIPRHAPPSNKSRNYVTKGGNLKHVIDPKYSLKNMPKERVRELNKASTRVKAEKKLIRKTFKESMGGLLELALSDNVVRARYSHRGIDTTDMQYIDAISMGIIQRAISGDVNAAREARMIMGEYGAEEPSNSVINLTIKRAAPNPNAPKLPRPTFEDDEDL